MPTKEYIRPDFISGRWIKFMYDSFECYGRTYCTNIDSGEKMIGCVDEKGNIMTLKYDNQIVTKIKYLK